MITKFDKFLNENYLTLRDELYHFFEDLGIYIMIYVEDRQSFIVEFDFKLTKKEEWLEKFVQICKKWSYEVYVENNRAYLTAIFGKIYTPEEYNQFDD